MGSAMPSILRSRGARLFFVLSLWWIGLASVAYYVVLLVYSASFYKRRIFTFTWMFHWQNGWNAWGQHGVIPFFSPAPFLAVLFVPILASLVLVWAVRMSRRFVRA